ncbi:MULTISPECIES: DNA cytosine methyltransferase [unclassified Pseudomonas]|uniref:DNA cytosine methyltransferase n=1 Tax=unclassified Pseudomonas TaxID=196821 RepID=UPI0004BBFD5D|nr:MULTISPECIES: DNA cytosine methyltransferase [unclassified Pseudomonas]
MQLKNSSIEKPAPTCIDLFAGCGGLSLGLKASGWEGIFAIERDPMAFETLSNNFLKEKSPYRSFSKWPEWLQKTNQDIVAILESDVHREKLKELRGTITLMAGGPPCQGFSVGGRRDGTDERNNLVFQMLDMVSLVRPRVVLIENVEGIARKFVARPGEEKLSIADEVIKNLTSLGYVSTYHILEARDFGVPQSRRRVAILGVLNAGVHSDELKSDFISLLELSATAVRQSRGLQLFGDITAKEAIHDLHGGELKPCPDSLKFETSVYSKPLSAYAKAMRCGIRTGSSPDSHRFSQHGTRIKELYDLAHRTQRPGRLSKNFLLENNTKKDKKVLIDPDDLVSTITTHPDEFIHYVDSRNITVREMARFQSFPDNFTFHGRYTINGPRRKFDVARCSQVGNAVPPLMAEGIGIAIRKLLERLDSREIYETTEKHTPSTTMDLFETLAS